MGALEILLMVLLGAVVVVLFAGIITMGNADPKIRTLNNTLMRYRVILQGAAVALLGLIIYLSQT